MIKTNSLDLERLNSQVGTTDHKTMFYELVSAYRRDQPSNIPEALLEEIEDFTERNSLAIVGHTVKNHLPIHKCCDRCLKAHLIKTAKTLELDKNLLRKIEVAFNCETGHDEYYIDEGELKKI
ncbi:hypothetical protein J4408_00975 [Candidatus Pacearchaeota archaeon]|nr:hypothetical protein [Candidatus Pacearchaeota archaeon]